MSGRALVACQVALSLVLLVGTGLLVRTLVNLKTMDAGFRQSSVLLFWFDARGSKTEVMNIYPNLRARLQGLPGVQSASVSTMSPLATNSETRAIRVLGPAAASRPPGVVNNRITADYFATFGIPIVEGRAVGAGDASGAAAVAVVNQTMARAFFGSESPIGRTFSFGSEPGAPVTIVGVARDARIFTLRDPVQPMVYTPVAQASEPQSLLTAALRTSLDPRALESAVRAAVRSTSGDLVVSYVRTIDEQVAASLVRERLLAALSIAFGIVAATLSCVGLYGVLAYTVTRRIREIGIRLALGAARGRILRHVLRQALAICGAGVVAGLAAAWFTARLVSSLVFGVTPTDPITFTLAALLLLVVGLAAAAIPARRASLADPALTLRAE